MTGMAGQGLKTLETWNRWSLEIVCTGRGKGIPEVRQNWERMKTAKFLGWREGAYKHKESSFFERRSDRGSGGRRGRFEN